MAVGISPCPPFNRLKSSIPFVGDALVWLNGEIITIGANRYFRDVSGNDRHFMISADDISNPFNGLPYKCAATVSAPVADAVLIAEDVNFFMYDNLGNPRNLPVTAFFQDIEYAHKIFCKHLPQQLDANGTEIFEPRVTDFVVYDTVKAGADLTTCQAYFNVPVEELVSVRWVATWGNDAWAGTKAAPYRNLSAIRNVAVTHAYICNGDYSPAAAITWTGAAMLVQGTGYCTVTLPVVATGFNIQRPITFKNLIIDGTPTTAYASICNGSVEYNQCLLTKTTNNVFVESQAGMILARFKDCTLNCTGVPGLCNNFAIFTTLDIIGCYGRIKFNLTALRPCTTINLKYNRCTVADAITANSTDINVHGNTGFGLTTLNAVNPVVFNYDYANYALSLSGAIQISNSVMICNITSTGIAAVNNSVITGNILNGAASTYNVMTLTGNMTGSPQSITNSITTGYINITAINNQTITDNIMNNTAAIILEINAANNANITGVVVTDNKFYGNHNALYLVYVGAIAENGFNAINGLTFERNLIQNSFIGVGGCHNLFIGGGINDTIRYNKIVSPNGYGLVIKAGGTHYTTVDAHVSYNIFVFNAITLQGIYGRGVWGLIVANNVLIGYRGISSAFHIDDDGAGLDNSMLCENNLILLGGNTTNYALGANMTNTHNSINKNGFVLTQAIGVNDEEIFTVINNDGVPVVRINNGVVIAGANNTGLAIGYDIPDAVTYQNQDANWQRGAIVGP